MPSFLGYDELSRICSLEQRKKEREMERSIQEMRCLGRAYKRRRINTCALPECLLKYHMSVLTSCPALSMCKRIGKLAPCRYPSTPDPALLSQNGRSTKLYLFQATQLCIQHIPQVCRFFQILVQSIPIPHQPLRKPHQLLIRCTRPDQALKPSPFPL